MRRYNKRFLYDDLKSILRIAEGALEVAVLAGLYYFSVSFFYPEICDGPVKQYISMDLYLMLVLLVFGMCDGFKFGYLKMTVLLITQSFSICIVDVIAYFQICLMASRVVPLWGALTMLVMDICVVLLMSYAFTFVYHKTNIPHRMLLVYEDARAMSLKYKMDTRQDSYRVTETVSAKIGISALRKKILDYDAVILSNLQPAMRDDLLRHCYTNEICAYVAPEVSDIILSGGQEITLFDTPLRLVKGRGLTYPQRFVKRLCDVVFSALAIILFLPVMIGIAVAIKLDDRGPVFFHQKRVTRNGRVFEILKFRSMIVGAEREGEFHPATDNDRRITQVGRWIRKFRLDELPQLFNIVKGDMSIVGPRPERVEHVQIYAAEIPEWHLREKVRGGLTGYAQVFGKYNTDAYDKLRLDLMYIEEYSFFLDVKLLLMTPRALFNKESVEGFQSDSLVAEVGEEKHG